jgi:uracil phosphoribosyltransferase
MSLQVLNHPLAHHLLACLRDKETCPAQFRTLSNNLTKLLAIQATYGMRTTECEIETPIKRTGCRKLDQPLAVVPVLRAGLGMLEPIVQLFPEVAVGYIGLERHHDTAIARSYYSKLPNLKGAYSLCLDPMLATGGSAAQAIGLMKAHGAEQITMVCVVAAPDGVRKMQEVHPDVPIVAGALDEGLNDLKYIVPGLGDFGDRLYGTM